MALASNRSTPSRGRYFAVLVPLWAASLLYVWSAIRYGWIPHDEGTLAQAAERVVLGELPHRDFDEVYTGGLDWWNGAAFRVFGTSLWSMRIALFLVFALWVPAVFWITTRFTRPLLAVPIVALCVVWSLPIYAAPMPSWYVLFLATFGTAALLAHREDGRARWLVAAGACGGLATLAKITGLHFVAAALLFLAWREPALSAPAGTADAKPGRLYPLAMTLALAAFAAALLKQVWALGVRVGGLLGEIEHFVLPGALLAALVARRAWMGSRAPDSVRFRALLGLVAPLLAGLALPLGVFAARYAFAGALGSLIEGVLILPVRRMALPTASTPPPELWSLVYLLPVAGIAAIPPARGRRFSAVALVASGAVLLTIAGLSLLPEQATVFFAGHDWGPNEAFWSLHMLPCHVVPFLAAVFCWRTWRGGAALGSRSPDGAFLLVSVTALVSLVRFPFTVPIYFFYYAPLLVLAVLATLETPGSWIRERPGVALLAGFYVLFMLAVPMRVGAKSVGAAGTRMQTPRSGLDLWIGDVREYDLVVDELRAHAKGGYVWAGPDAPEVPFLAGFRNPTRTIFDVFDSDYGAPKEQRIARLLADFEAHGVKAAALNRAPSFSDPVSPELKKALEGYFPHGTTLWKFVIVWRE